MNVDGKTFSFKLNRDSQVIHLEVKFPSRHMFKTTQEVAEILQQGYNIRLMDAT